jgi:sRNA-binding carbon storage regulator CsrA
MKASPMGYLVLSRKEGDSLHLSIDPEADPAKVLEQLRSGIYIDITQIEGSQVRLGIEAPDELIVLRGELLERQT